MIVYVSVQPDKVTIDRCLQQYFVNSALQLDSFEGDFSDIDHLSDELNQ